eukprot:s4461_g9.t1
MPDTRHPPLKGILKRPGDRRRSHRKTKVQWAHKLLREHTTHALDSLDEAATAEVFWPADASKDVTCAYCDGRVLERLVFVAESPDGQRDLICQLCSQVQPGHLVSSKPGRGGVGWLRLDGEERPPYRPCPMEVEEQLQLCARLLQSLQPQRRPSLLRRPSAESRSKPALSLFKVSFEGVRKVIEAEALSQKEAKKELFWSSERLRSVVCASCSSLCRADKGFVVEAYDGRMDMICPTCSSDWPRHLLSSVPGVGAGWLKLRHEQMPGLHRAVPDADTEDAVTVTETETEDETEPESESTEESVSLAWVKSATSRRIQTAGASDST